MNWLLSVISSVLPDIWILAAIGAGLLWLNATFIAPAPMNEPVRWAAIALVCVAVYLHTYASATRAFEERMRAAVEAEKTRQAQINRQAVEESRREAEHAAAMLRDLQGRLDQVVNTAARAERNEDCGLDAETVRGILNLGR